MSIWNIRFTCPGRIFCPRNTHTFGNEWHTDCCALSGILFVVELEEGKACTCQDGSLDFDDLVSNNVGLLLRTMKSYFSTGRYIIIDSGFCVLKGLIELSEKCVFDCAIIKKRKY